MNSNFRPPLSTINRWFLACLINSVLAASGLAQTNENPLRIFIFAGQSNMEGADSSVDDIQKFPPFHGLEAPQPTVRFSYSIGRNQKETSNGWVPLQSVRNFVGPELSFARVVTEAIDAPIAIIKCAAGGTHLGGDWNPDTPSGFNMYPLLLDLVQTSLNQLDDKGIPYQLEGFMWHQGENDMFNEDYLANYDKNLANFIARARRDLNAPDLPFYIGELCAKTIWGMDLRPRMYAISQAQKKVTAQDRLADYIPTAHIGVEIGDPVGLHYHYGTLGQLEHGVNYATAYLKRIGRVEEVDAKIPSWPIAKGETVQLFILAGHRNMEGERAFTQTLSELEKYKDLLNPNVKIPFRYSIGGAYKISDGWEALRPCGYYDTFGPELSFGDTLSNQLNRPIAIAKFTHSGSQIIDWTPEGSDATDRNLYPKFIQFIQSSIADLENRGHPVDVAGVFYHIGENDMSMPPYRKQAAEWIDAMIRASRRDLGLPDLQWVLSQQRPTDHESVNAIDVTEAISKIAKADMRAIHLKLFDLEFSEPHLVLSTKGVIDLGIALARQYLSQASFSEEN